MSRGLLSTDTELSLVSLGIPWKGSPRLWHTIPRTLLHTCTIQGKVLDLSGVLLYSLRPVEPLGTGTFGTVDSFWCKYVGGEEKLVAIKRPKYPDIDLFMEALFQWRTFHELKKYNVGFCIPEIYDIFTFKQTGDVWFSMQAYTTNLLSSWCLSNLSSEGTTFGYLMLQISLVLEILQNVLMIDHRDLKVNNILVVDSPVEIRIQWKGKIVKLHFPFHIVLLDFGYACAGGLIDVKHDGLPPIDLCPKEGRDIFQILVSLWRIDELRKILEKKWGAWIRARIESAIPKASYLRLTETAIDLNWMYSVTDNTKFRAPLCTPATVIADCMRILTID